jgi:hypothetical protein
MRWHETKSLQMSRYEVIKYTLLICGDKFPCRFRREYLHRRPASRRRLWKCNPLPWGITGPLCLLGDIIQRPVSRWGGEPRLMTLLCTETKGEKAKEVRSRWSNSQEWTKLARVFQGRPWQTRSCYFEDDDDDDDDDYYYHYHYYYYHCYYYYYYYY